MRYLPEANASETFDELQNYAQHTLKPVMQSTHSEADIHFESLAAYPPLLTDPQSEFVQWLIDWSGSNELGTVAFGTEGGLFDEAGVATLVCGPGSMDQGHKPDEFVTIKQLERCNAMLKNLRQWMSH